MGATGVNLVHHQGFLFTVSEVQGADQFTRLLLLRKLAPDGSEIWARTFGSPTANLFRTAYSIDVLDNGDLLFAGSRVPDLQTQTIYPYLVRTNLDGIVARDEPFQPLFRMGPNPTAGRVTLRSVEPLLEPGTIQVMDVQGRLVHRGQWTGELTLDLAAEANGMYIVEIEVPGEGLHRQRIVVAH